MPDDDHPDDQPLPPATCVAVTGAMGKVGRWICPELEAADLQVIRSDTTPPSEVRKASEAELKLDVRIADMRDRDAAARAIEGADAVVHLANIPNGSLADAPTLVRDNTTMTINVIDAAMQAGVRRVIFASSVQVIASDRGPLDHQPCRLPYLPADGNVPPQPGNHYGLSKEIGEAAMAWAHRSVGGQWVCLRLPRMVAWDWDRFREANQQRTELTERDRLDDLFAWLHGSDAGRLMAAILTSDRAGFRVLMPAAEEAYVQCDIPSLLAEHYADVPLRRPAEAMKGLVDIDAIQRDFGWSPRFRLWD